MKRICRTGKGTSDVTVILMILGAAVAISIAYFTLNWIISIKEARSKGKETEQPPPPKSVEEMGGYEVTY